MSFRWALGAALWLMACQDKPAPPLSSLAPRPLPRVAPSEEERSPPAPVLGDSLPAHAVTLELRGLNVGLGAEAVEVDNPQALRQLRTRLGGAPVLLVPDSDTFLAQVAPLLAFLDDAQIETWLADPTRQVAYRVVLRDEPAFQRWLDEPKAGKIRIIQRSDGLEVQTNVGKLPGLDPNGPTVMVRGGALDVGALRRSLTRLKERFDEAPDICLVPSFGTELSRVAQALSGDYAGPAKRLFEQLCLVYPRPTPRDGG